MKKSIKIAIILVSVALLISCTALYDKLSQEYAPDNLETLPTSSTTTQKNESTDSGDSDLQDPPADDSADVQFGAPDFIVLDVDGNEIKLSSFAGKPVVLNFWGTWCGYCKAEMPDFQAMHEKYPDVQFVMVNYGDSISTAESYVQQNGFTFSVFFDTTGNAVTAYSVTGFPSSFFINAQGELVAQARGMLSAAQLENGIKMITEE